MRPSIFTTLPLLLLPIMVVGYVWGFTHYPVITGIILTADIMATVMVRRKVVGVR